MTEHRSDPSGARAPGAVPRQAGDVRVHVIRTGRLVGNRTFLRGEGWSSLVRRPVPYEFPCHAFILERPDGLLAVDTGITSRARSPRPLLQRRIVPDPFVEAEIGPAMRASGLDPADVRTVVLTHLDWDHAGGLAHFPRARVLVHRPEAEAATTLGGRRRYEPGLWPAAFAPTLYDLDPEPWGPFGASTALDADGDLRLVPIPGHSAGQVGVVIRSGRCWIFLCADHTLRQDWFLEDAAAGRLVQLGIWFRRQAIETSRRIERMIRAVPTVLVPSHDSGAPARLASLEVAVAGSAPSRGDSLDTPVAASGSLATR